MKKIFTLMAAGLFITATSFAQWNDGRNDQNRGNGNYGNGNYGYGNNGYNKDPYNVFNFRSEDELLRNMNLSRQQERRVSKINQQFQQAIYRIQYDRFSSAQQRNWQLQRLEQQRRQDIQNVLSNYQRERYNAWCTRNNTYGNNNGYSGQGNGNGRW